jgi:hypothetical protein
LGTVACGVGDDSQKTEDRQEFHSLLLLRQLDYR